MKSRFQYYYALNFILIVSHQLFSQNTWEIIREDPDNKRIVFKDASGVINNTIDFSDSYRVDLNKNPLVTMDHTIQRIYYSKPNATIYAIVTSYSKVSKPDPKISSSKWSRDYRNYFTVYNNKGIKQWDDMETKNSIVFNRDIIISNNDSTIIAYASIHTPLRKTEPSAMLRIYNRDGKLVDVVDGSTLGESFEEIDEINVSENGQYIAFENLYAYQDNIYLYSMKSKTLVRPSTNGKIYSLISIFNNGEAKIREGKSAYDKVLLIHVDY